VRRGSSVPGHVSQLPGGVGRNIAEAAHHLLAAAAAHAERHQPGDRQQRESVLLVSAIGQDTAADALLASFAQHGWAAAGAAGAGGGRTRVCTLVSLQP
jgi:sugar/nucleoside kinase (ribokinase family)